MSGELPWRLESDGDADEHSEPGLLGDERPHPPYPLVGILLAGHAGDLALVRLAEPTAGVQGLGQHALQLRRDPSDAVLRPGKPLGSADRRDGGVQLRVTDLTVEHGRA